MPPNVLHFDEIVDHSAPTRTVVVVGLGMVGLRFIEKLLELDSERKWYIHVFCEEPRGNADYLSMRLTKKKKVDFACILVAYNRVGLTQYFAHRDAGRLLMQPPEWYANNRIQLHVNTRATRLNSVEKWIESADGRQVNYDICVLATGSTPLLPPNMLGLDGKGVFIYRTIEDLDSIIAYSSQCKSAAVVGGGLLGLEAAKAAKDLGMEVTVCERSTRLMNRQLDEEGAEVLLSEIKKMGINTRLGESPMEILLDEEGRCRGLKYDKSENLNVDMVIFSIGIIPRDDFAKASGIQCHPRGGVLVDDSLKTSVDSVFAVGECVVYNNMVYGLVAPGYEMAEIVARNLTGGTSLFKGADMSTKLKLLGVHVASFGDINDSNARPLVYRDPFAGVYKKYFFNEGGTKILGGIMVGDTKDYAKLHSFCTSNRRLPCPPGELILGSAGQAGGGDGVEELPDEVQICSCNNVTKGCIRQAVRDGCRSVGEVKSCTKAGTGCGGCLPQVTEIVGCQLKSMGETVKNSLCPHFDYSRVEVFQIVKVKKLKTFREVMEHAGKNGRAFGCEVCKPTIASILASLWNDHILEKDHTPLQDSNDRFLANIQRGGTYSVVPRVPGGEITPEKLLVIGDIAKEYGLYTKITGGQRIDMFGARREDLPNIWEKLVDAGFESGHAYGKALRTVKSCVGSTWCRYGVRDSVGFAIMIENRYKGIRAPHKIKGAVSGCIRECAEAQGKDFGLIATDKGYNIYVCGNGGSKPKHALLLAADVPEEKCIRYLDRFIAFYIATADRLQRTARWLEKLEGGIEQLRRVIIDDHLGIAEELERQMQYLITTYQDEWATVVKDPIKRARFKQFVNTEESQPGIDVIQERGQQRPADWPKEIDRVDIGLEQDTIGNGALQKRLAQDRSWVPVGKAGAFIRDVGEVIKHGRSQIAVFRTSDDKWFATQNMCPHKRAFVLSQGILGDHEENGNATPYVSCPMHKKNFSLKSGNCLTGEDYKLLTFDVRVGESPSDATNEDAIVYVHLPPPEILDSVLATEKLMVKKEEASSISIESVGGCGGCGDKALEW
ncbi:uncharacterized protein VTP21DRAFT_3943 [Calcarisporiella thermophila]|uniref:uncharacterized protein n=1 Tax=Calcarisporiella thermophila TaxID=911321 RepID=UPI003742204B